jgi:hypothetical protein
MLALTVLSQWTPLVEHSESIFELLLLHTIKALQYPIMDRHRVGRWYCENERWEGNNKRS